MKPIAGWRSHCAIGDGVSSVIISRWQPRLYCIGIPDLRDHKTRGVMCGCEHVVLKVFGLRETTGMHAPAQATTDHLDMSESGPALQYLTIVECSMKTW
jgi:hypothetical protein